MITKEKFEAFDSVRKSGITNMFDLVAVMKYAKQFSGISLNKKDVLEIYRDYAELKNKYSKL